MILREKASCSDFLCNRDIKGKKFVCVGVEFLAFNVLLLIRSEEKVIGNRFCTPIILKSPVFQYEIYFYNLCRVWIVIGFF